MWPMIGNPTDEFAKRDPLSFLPQFPRNQYPTPITEAPPVRRPRKRWVVRSLRGTGNTMVRIADRLDGPRHRAESAKRDEHAKAA